MPGEEIRALNDAFRTTMTGGKVMMTAGVDALPSDIKAMVLRRVATFSDFTKDNNPHGEHDFGKLYARRSQVLLEDRLLRREYGVRLGRPDQPQRNNTRPYDYARQRVLIARPAVRGASLCPLLQAAIFLFVPRWRSVVAMRSKARSISLPAAGDVFHPFSKLVEITVDLFQVSLDAPNLCVERTDVGFEFPS